MHRQRDLEAQSPGGTVGGSALRQSAVSAFDLTNVKARRGPERSRQMNEIYLLVLKSRTMVFLPATGIG
jgi:hypothetical protein